MQHCALHFARRPKLALVAIDFASSSSGTWLAVYNPSRFGIRVARTPVNGHTHSSFGEDLRQTMAGFSESLDGSAFPALDQLDRSPATVQAPATRNQETRGSWGGLLGTGPDRDGLTNGAGATSHFSTEVSDSSLRGAASASARREGRQVAPTAYEEGEEKVAAFSGRQEAARSGGGRGRGAAKGGRGKRGDDIENLGRSFTQILRHSALEHGLSMRSDGFVLVSDILKLHKKTRSNRPLGSHSLDEVRQAVALDNKGRLELREEEGQVWIRATQGHSIKVIDPAALLRPVADASEIPVCVHGTYKRHLDAIFAEGLKPMNRNHVHFATGLPKEDGVISGMRASCELLIFLDVERALRDGMKLWVSSNGVILTDGLNGAVRREYFKEVQTARGRQSIPIPPR